MKHRLRRLIDRVDDWFRPDVVPPTRTDWWKSQVQKSVRGSLLTFLKLLLWLLG